MPVGELRVTLTCMAKKATLNAKRQRVALENLCMTDSTWPKHCKVTRPGAAARNTRKINYVSEISSDVSNCTNMPEKISIARGLAVTSH